MRVQGKDGWTTYWAWRYQGPFSEFPNLPFTDFPPVVNLRLFFSTTTNLSSFARIFTFELYLKFVRIMWGPPFGYEAYHLVHGRLCHGRFTERVLKMTFLSVFYFFIFI